MIYFLVLLYQFSCFLVAADTFSCIDPVLKKEMFRKSIFFFNLSVQDLWTNASFFLNFQTVMAGVRQIEWSL